MKTYRYLYIPIQNICFTFLLFTCFFIYFICW